MFTSISPRARASEARAVRQRPGDHSPWRGGATSIVSKDFLPAIAPKSPLLGRAMDVLQIARWWNSAADLPDVSKCFRGIAQSIHASDHHATLHGVVFDILVGSESRVGRAQDGLPSRSSRPRPPSPKSGLWRGSLHSLRERRLVGPAGLEPATRPL